MLRTIVAETVAVEVEKKIKPLQQQLNGVQEQLEVVQHKCGVMQQQLNGVQEQLNVVQGVCALVVSSFFSWLIQHLVD